VVIFDGSTGNLIADSGFTIEKSVPSDAKFTDTTYTVDSNGLDIDSNNQISIVFGNTAGTVAAGNDPRLSDARTPVSHNHGNINNDGELLENGIVSNKNALLRITSGEITIGPEFGNNADRFLNNLGSWAEIQFPVTSVNNQTGDVVITAADLGISQSMHFIGSVATNSTYHPSDGTAPGPNQTLIIAGLSSYTPTAGDIIIDKNDEREYIYTTANLWEVLGTDESFKVI